MIGLDSRLAASARKTTCRNGKLLIIVFAPIMVNLCVHVYLCFMFLVYEEGSTAPIYKLLETLL